MPHSKPKGAAENAHEKDDEAVARVIEGKIDIASTGASSGTNDPRLGKYTLSELIRLVGYPQAKTLNLKGATRTDRGEGKMSMQYPSASLQRNLDIGWKRMVADEAIDAKASGGDRYLHTIAMKVWPDTRNFSPNEFYAPKGQKREEYQKAKKLYDSRKKTLKKWVDERLAGKYDDLANTRVRTGPQGRNLKYKELKDALYDSPTHTAEASGGRVGSNLMRARTFRAFEGQP